jgi:glycerol-3-phosphate dehydrogenase
MASALASLPAAASHARQRGVMSTARNIALASRLRRSVDDAVDVVVVGGGVVGCSVARAVAVAGRSVLVIERERAVGASPSSGGNSGIGCTGYDAPRGSVEQALLRRSVALHGPLFRSLGLRGRHTLGCPAGGAGALVVAWSEAELAGLEKVIEDNRVAGDDSVAWVDRRELLEREPSLNRDAVAAVHCPHEVPFDPWLLPVAYAESAMRHGAEFLLGAEVLRAKRVLQDGEELTKVTYQAHGCASRDTAPITRHARVVVNCGGLHGDEVEALRPTSTLSHEAAGAHGFSIAPRKGTFAVFGPASRGKLLPRHILQMAPTDHSKGVIVWANCHGQIMVGPTAEDVPSRVDRSVDPAVIARLVAHGTRVVPALAQCVQIGSYSGLRPATEHRDYRIGRVSGSGWITVGGIRSTGVSASAAIGEHVAALIACELDGSPMDPPLPSLVGVSAAAATTVQLPPGVVDNDEVPSYQDLQRDYRSRGDGCVSLWGRTWRVCHPQTRFGLGVVENS